MDGRVKTLHPKIHAGLLGRRGVDDAVMAQHAIAPIDLLVVNLYPFAATVARPGCAYADAVENIDIGGLRCCARRRRTMIVLVVVDRRIIRCCSPSSIPTRVASELPRARASPQGLLHYRPLRRPGRRLPVLTAGAAG